MVLLIVVLAISSAIEAPPIYFLGFSVLFLFVKILIGFAVYGLFSLLGFVALCLQHGSVSKARKEVAEGYDNNYMNLAQVSLLNMMAAAMIGFVLWVMYKTLGQSRR